MSKCLIILLCLFGITKSYCQIPPELLSPKGSMSEIKLFYDTVLNLKIVKTDAKIKFAKVDTSNVTDTRLKSKLAEFLSSKSDSSYDYFFIYNTTDNPISLSYHFGNNALTGIQLAKSSSNEFRPISYIVVQRCCLDCSNKIVKRGDLLIFKKRRPEFKGYYLTQSKLKLSKQLVSESFSEIVDENAFYINSKYLEDLRNHKARVIFLDK